MSYDPNAPIGYEIVETSEDMVEPLRDATSVGSTVLRLIVGGAGDAAGWMRNRTRNRRNNCPELRLITEADVVAADRAFHLPDATTPID